LSKDQFSRYAFGMAFHAPDHLFIKETEHWIVNHRIDAALPGYLMVAARLETNDLAALPSAALAELGPLLAACQQTLTDCLHPDHLYVSRYGHMAGLSIHFHVIPVYSWVKEAFLADARYRVLRSLYTPGVFTSNPDGGELTLYVWREFCESKTPPPIHGPSIAEAVKLLREKLAAAWMPINAGRK
jgi:diadenosine tetraphosphate (Ap4A) HIT family hydrolase